MAKSTSARRPRRSAGEGAVYETADGRFRGAVVLSDPSGERSVRRYVSGRNRAEVVRRIEALRREGAAGFATGKTVGDYLAGWTSTVRSRIRPATHREYARHVD